MPVERYTFTIDRRGDEAAVMLNCGEGVYRCRLMPFAVLERLVEICDDIRRKTIPKCRRRRRFLSSVPPYPACIEVATAGIPGVCDVQVVASLDGADKVQFYIAVYDEGEHQWPVLALLEDQLAEFIERASEVILDAESLSGTNGPTAGNAG